MLEFSVDPAITYTRRLGPVGGSRVELLLVGFQSADDASGLLGHAKKLRRSTDNNVRNNDCTKLEAR